MDRPMNFLSEALSCTTHSTHDPHATRTTHQEPSPTRDEACSLLGRDGPFGTGIYPTINHHQEIKAEAADAHEPV